MARQNRSEFPQIPAIRTSDPQQTKFNAAVREALRMMTGTKEDRVLTLRDISGGALTGQTLKGALVDQGAQPPPGSGGPVQRPTQPTGVKANAGMQSVFLQWDLPTYSGHSYTEIYRFDADALALAQPVAKVVYVLFSEFIGSDTTYFYWLRHVNINGVAGPWNASEGTRLQTAIDVDEVLRSLSHQITESQFAQSLLDRIDLIDGDGGLTLQMQALAIQLNLADQRLSQANSDLDAKVQQGQSALALADSQLQSELVAAKGLLQEQLDVQGGAIVEQQQIADDQALLLSGLTHRVGQAENTIISVQQVSSEQASLLSSLESSNETQGASISILQSTTFGHAISISQLGAYDSAAEKYTFIKTLEEADAHQASRIGTLEADNGTTKSRLLSVESVNTEQASRLFVLETDNGTNKNKISTLEFADVAQAQRLNSLESSNETQGASISILQSTTFGHAISISQLGAYDSAAGKYTFIKTLEEADAHQASRIGTLEADNGTTKNRITAVENVNTEQASKLFVLEADNGTNKNKISTLEFADAAQAQRLNSLESSNGTTQSRLMTLEVADANQASRIQQLTLQNHPVPRCALLNEDEWEIEAGLPPSWSYNGTVAEQKIISGTGPYGGPAKLWQATADGDVGGDGGWNKGVLTPADVSKTYRYSVWVKAKPGCTGQFYLGCGYVHNLDNTANSNAYALAGTNHPKTAFLDKWVLAVGIIHPVGYTGGQSGLSGLYDPVTGQRVEAGTDYKFSPDNSGLQHRTYQYYSATPGSQMVFTHPRMEVMETAPSLNDLLKSGGQAAVQDAARAYTDTKTGEIRAERTIKVEADGRVAGIGLIAGGTSGSAIYFSADQVAILPPGATALAGAKLPFIYDAASGGVYMDTTFIRELTASSIRGGLLNLEQGNIRSLSVYNELQAPPQCIDEIHLSPALAAKLAWVNSGSVQTGGSITRTVYANVGATSMGTVVSGGQAATLKISGGGPAELSPDYMGGWIDVQILKAGVVVPLGGTNTLRLTISSSLMTDEALPRSTWRYAGFVEGGGTFTVPPGTANVTSNWAINIVAVSSAALASRFTVTGSVFETYSTSGSVSSAAEWSQIKNKPTTVAGFGLTDALPIYGGTMTGPINFNAGAVQTSDNINFQMNGVGIWRHGREADGDYRMWYYNNSGGYLGSFSFSRTGVLSAPVFSGYLSGTAATATTAGSIAGFNNPSATNVANTIAYRDGAGDVQARLFRSDYPAEPSFSGAIAYRVNNTTDNYTRFCSDPALVRNWIGSPSLAGVGAFGTWGVSITGNAGSALILAKQNDYSRKHSHLPVDYVEGQQVFFVGPEPTQGGWQSYGTVINTRTYGGGGGSLQMYVPYGTGNGGTGLQVRFGNYAVSEGNSWTNWKTLLASDNFNAYAVDLVSAQTVAGQKTFSGRIKVNDWIDPGATGIYYGSTNTYWYSNIGGTFILRGDTDYAQIQLQTNGGSPRGYIYADYQENIGFLKGSSGTWKFRVDPLGNLTLNESIKVTLYPNSVGFTNSTGGIARGLRAGALLLSSDFSDYGAVPDWGIYAVGSIVSATGFTGNGGGLTGVDANRLQGYSAANFLTAQSTFTARDANTQANMDANFTYAVNAPYTGPLIKMGTGGYELQLNAPYAAGDKIAFRTHNGDGPGWGSWREMASYESSNQYLLAKSWIRAATHCGLYWETGAHLQAGTAQTVQVRNSIGTVDIGPQNSAYCHIQTSMPSFYMDKSVYVDGSLDIYGSGTGTRLNGAGLAWTVPGVSLYSNGSAGIVINGPTTATSIVLQTSGTTRGYVYADAANAIGFLDQNGAWKLRVDSAGMLHVADGTSTSDRRVKRNIEPIQNALAKVKTLTGNTYDQIEMGIRRAGPIAQEIQLVLPEAVSADEHGKLAVSQMGLIALLIESVKELSAEVDTLKRRLH